MSRIIKTEKTEYDQQTGVVISQKEYSNLKDPNIITFKPNSTFTKVFCAIQPNFSKMVYAGYFFNLIRAVQTSSNLLVVRKQGSNGVRISVGHAEDLAEFIGVSLNSFRKFLTEAKKLGAIIGVTTTDGYGYIVNPAYAYNGEGIDIMLYMIFVKNEAFVNSLTITQITDYNNVTNTNYMENIRHNFPLIATKIEGE